MDGLLLYVILLIWFNAIDYLKPKVFQKEIYITCHQYILYFENIVEEEEEVSVSQIRHLLRPNC